MDLGRFRKLREVKHSSEEADIADILGAKLINNLFQVKGVGSDFSARRESP